MYALFLSNKKANTLEDAYSALTKIKDSNESKVVKKAEFHELKTKQRTTRETKEGKGDRFMIIMVKKNTKKTIHQYHLTAIIDRNMIYTD